MVGVFELSQPLTIEDEEETVATAPKKFKGGRKKGTINNCSKCGEPGHTVTTCKKGTVVTITESEKKEPTSAETGTTFVIPEHLETITDLVNAGNTDEQIFNHVHNHMTKEEIDAAIKLARDDV